MAWFLYDKGLRHERANYPQKISLQIFKPLFQLILRSFELECHGQTSLKVALVKFAHVFMKFRKLEGLHTENKKLHPIKQKQPPEVFYKKKCF